MNSSPPNKRIINVAVVYDCIAHYRFGVFSALHDAPTGDFRFHFFSDDHSNISSLKTLTLEELESLPWSRIKNHWFFRYFLWQSGLIKLARDPEFDVIIFFGNMYFLSTWIAAFIARRQGKKILMWTHGFRRRESGIRKVFRLRFYGLADRLLVYGNRAKDILVEFGFPAERVDVIYNSLNYAEQNRCRALLSDTLLSQTRELIFGDGNTPYLVYVGRLIENKDLDLLIESLSDSRLNSSELRLLIVGSGPSLEKLQELANRRAISDRVKFYGPCYDELELSRLISGAAAMVVPGAIGLSCIHALAYGTPVITCDDFNTHGPEVEAIEDGTTGFFFQRGSRESLAEVVQYCLNQRSVRELVRKKCINAVEAQYTPIVQARLIKNACAAACS